jgi:nucleoid-associated protein YgaU
MGLFNFIKDAGEKIFGKKAAASAAVVATKVDRGAELEKVVRDLGLEIENLKIKMDGDLASVKGVAPSQEVREKVILVLGNTQGVAQVDDQMTVERPEPQAAFHTVERGDTLSKIAKEHYGNASKYMKIFEANQPMLKDPNKIYPGQVLRIPPEDV